MSNEIGTITPVQFMETDNIRVAWTAVGSTALFLRKAQRMLGGKVCLRVFDVASVEVHEQFRGMGLFTGLIEDLAAQAKERGFEAVYVENVLEPRFADFFRRGNWVEIPNPLTPCFYRLL